MGTAGATIVVSTEAKKLGNINPATIFHRYFLRRDVSAFVLSASSASTTGALMLVLSSP